MTLKEHAIQKMETSVEAILAAIKNKETEKAKSEYISASGSLRGYYNASVLVDWNYSRFLKLLNDMYEDVFLQ